MEISPVKDTLRIALVGDYNAGITAHQAIPLAIDDAAAVLELLADYDGTVLLVNLAAYIFTVIVP